MGIKQVKVASSDIALGMFVSGLDRPWIQTPFPIQGFLIRNPNELKALKTYCDYIYINVTKGRGPLDGPASVTTQKPSKSALQELMQGNKNNDFSQHVESPPLDVRRDVYPHADSLRQESSKAEEPLLQLRGSFTLAMKQIAKGKDVDYKALKENVSEMVDSVIRCPDAFTWLLRLRLKDQHSHDHSMRSALWAVQFGRYIGIPKQEMTILCLGTMLKDVGKLKLPNGLLRKKHRSIEEDKEYKNFVLKGVEMLKASGNIEPRVITVVRYHCERNDGSGFPAGIGGGKIPLLARIAGIATTYDAISNPRETEHPVAPSRAVSLLYNMRGKKFQEDLTVEFIQSIGLYPTGTLVELTTGDIGVVMEQNPNSRLTPKVVIIPHDAANDDAYILVDLENEEFSREAMLKGGLENAAAVSRLAIARDLESSGYDIDLKKASGMVMDYSESSLGAMLGAQQEKSAEKSGLLKGFRARFFGR